jgi:hypothetical protein
MRFRLLKIRSLKPPFTPNPRRNRCNKAFTSTRNTITHAERRELLSAVGEAKTRLCEKVEELERWEEQHGAIKE